MMFSKHRWHKNADDGNLVEIKCANCGAVVADNFCPHCGQPRQGSQRLTLGSFLKSGVSEWSKINTGFFFTVGHLLLQPWNVIRDFINGRRARYTKPVTMLVIIVLYLSIMSSVFGVDLWNTQFHGTYDENDPLLDKIEIIVFTNQVLTNILLSIPITLAVYMVYFFAGSRRYNLAEYLTAVIYMLCTFILIGIVASILRYIFPSIRWWNLYDKIWMVIMFGIALFKAFKIRGITGRFANVAARISMAVVATTVTIVLVFLFIFTLTYLISGAIEIYIYGTTYHLYP